MNNAIEKAKSRNSLEGLKLGNYHYNVDDSAHPDGERTHIYLTRYNEECADCKLWNECQGYKPSGACAAENCLPVEPYRDTYDLTYYSSLNVLESDGCAAEELTDMDKLAILLAAGCCSAETAYKGIFKN